MKPPPRVLALVNSAKVYREIAASYRAFADAVEDLAKIDLETAAGHLAIAAVYAKRCGDLDPETPKSSRRKTRARRKP